MTYGTLDAAQNLAEVVEERLGAGYRATERVSLTARQIVSVVRVDLPAATTEIGASLLCLSRAFFERGRQEDLPRPLVETLDVLALVGWALYAEKAIP